jgi:ketosteroid isomerase-like protein
MNHDLAANTATAVRCMHAIGAGDGAVIDSVLAADAVAVARGTSILSGERDRATIMATVGMLAQLAPGGISFEVLDTTAQDNRVVVSAKGTSTLFNGEAYNNDYCMVFFFDAAGQVTRMQEMFDTKLADGVLGPLMGG